MTRPPTKTKTNRIRSSILALPICIAASGTLGALTIGCGDESSSEAEDDDFSGPLYAMMIQVYDPEDRTVYISLSDTLDVKSVSLSAAREFPSVANFAAIDGRLLVSSGSKPEITEFDITSKLRWIQRRNISFASYDLPEDGANFYGQFIIDPEHALLPFGDGTQRILWNPSEMAIERSLEDSTLTSAEPGLTMDPGGNRNAVHYDAGVMQPFFYHDDDWYHFGTQSHVVVYDADTFEEDHIVDVPCPGLSNATRDEAGNTYFSTWDVPVTSITGEAPAMCVAKLDADGELVETIDLADWTDGRVNVNFRYVGGGKAIVNVLHHEVLGFSSPEELDSQALDEDIWLSGSHWKLWLLDMEERTGAPIDGIDVPISGWSQFSVVDDRTFVFLPYDDDARTRAYELQSDGTAVEHFDTVGDLFKWVRVR